MNVPGTFSIQTLGCKINQYESQALREAWLASGLDEADTPAGADIVLVNSCAVTAGAVRDLRSLVRRLHRENPSARIVVTGCAAQVMTRELENLEGVCRVVPQQDKRSLADMFRESADSDQGGLRVADSPRARGTLKVQDGCAHRCTYCIVPLTRGPSRSRDPEDIVAEARRLLESGLRELVISGINLRLFGRDLDGPWNLWRLVRHLEARLAPDWAGRARLRISSLDPGQLDSDALETLAASRMVAPHLHLSVQSFSPSILRRMNRAHYAPENIFDFVDSLRGIWPVFGLGADLLAGFPGESETEHRQTLEGCDRLPLSYAHVFPYSQRPGTPAASMPQQVDARERKKRAARLRGCIAGKRKTFLSDLLAVGSMDVILERTSPPTGTSGEYVSCTLTRLPENAGERSLIRARPLAVGKDAILADPLDGGRLS